MAAHQIGASPAGGGAVIGPAPNLYAIDPAMTVTQINALLASLSGTNTVIVPDGTPQALYATNGQHLWDARLNASWFQMPGIACDGHQSSAGITLTSGTNTSTVGGTLSAADIGKTFFFFNRTGYALADTQSLWTAKLNAYSGGVATWSANAPFGFSNQVYYGTDNLATVQAAMTQATQALPLTIPTGCGILVNGTIAWDNNQVVVGRSYGAGGFIGRPGADVIATQDTSGKTVNGPGTGLGNFFIFNGTEIDWTLGYDLYSSTGTLTVVPPVYRPLYQHSSLAADPLGPGWLTGGKNGVAATTQNSAVICTPNALPPPAVGQQIMFPYFASIFASTISSTAGSCSAGFTARTMAAALPNTAGYTVAQAEWFTGSAIQSTTTSIPTTITYPLTLNVTLSTNYAPGWPSNFPQHGTVKVCGIEAEYMGVTGATMILRRGPTSSAGCTGTTPIAPMNPCRAKNLLGSNADQPWPVVPTVNSGDSTPSGANWFPGECGGNYAIAFPTANGNAYVGNGLAGGFLTDLEILGTATGGTNSANANNAGTIYIAGNNAPFGSHFDNITASNLQYGISQGPASAGQHGVKAVGPTGFGNTWHNLWLFTAFPLAFVDMQGSNVTEMNMNSTEISPFDGSGVGSATCLQVGYTLDEQDGTDVTSTGFDHFDTYGCEPENGSHIEVLPAVDIQGSNISFDTANFEGVPNIFGGDHLKLTNSFLGLPTIDYGSSNDFGVVSGSNAGYQTNVWDNSPQFLTWGKNAQCSMFAGGQGPPIKCGPGTVQGYQGRGVDASVNGTTAGGYDALGGMITPWMWNTDTGLDNPAMTTAGVPDATAPYWGSSATCAIGGGNTCQSVHFNGFNGFIYIGAWNQLAPIPYQLDASFKTLSAGSTFTLTINAESSGSGTCSGANLYTGTIATTTSFSPPAIPPNVDMTGRQGCVLQVVFGGGSTNDTLVIDRFNFVPLPNSVRGPAVAPTYPGSCPAGAPPSSWLGSFGGFAYFCDGVAVHRVGIS